MHLYTRASMPFAGTERFELRRQLGRGGMGVVYEVYDHHRGMRVALKTLRRLDANGLLRFKREFRTLNDLSHPNIIDLYELVSAGRDWFFTMEFVDGQDLISHVRGFEPDASLSYPAPESPALAAGARPKGHTQGHTRPLSHDFPQEPDEPADTPQPPDTHTSTFQDDATMVDMPDRLAPVAAPDDLDPATWMQGARPDVPAEANRSELDELLDRARLWETLGQLASALCALHDAGMVHCDLKPANVMVTHEGRVVLMDFGVAAVSGWSQGLDWLNEAEGTPAFMAPEHARGEPPTAAADWYSFGVTLYLLLTGRLPFDGDIGQILIDKQELDPLPPSTFTRGIPHELETLCMGLLMRDPALRPPAGEVLALFGGRPPKRRASQRFGSVPVDGDLFVGRDYERAVLHDSYAAVRAGEMRCVAVDGPSGMGKTSLITRFLQEIHANQPQNAPWVLMARCHERESLAYKAFDGIIDQLSQRLQDMPVRQRRAVLPEGVGLLARLFPVLRRVKELDTPFQVAGGMELRMQAVRTLRTLLGALARERPIIACIDDLQWADSDSFDLLLGLMQEPAPGGLLVLATLRTESLDAGTDPSLGPLLAALDGAATSRRIHLEPLSAGEQSDLVRQLGERRGLQRPIDDALVQESSGHPMLLAELARYAEEAPEDLAAAHGLRLEDVIWRRVERLPGVARALIETIAIAGEPTPLRVLAEAAALSPAERERALSIATAVHLARVTRTEAEPWPEPWIDAYHDKVRECIAERLPAERVQTLHGSIARALESLDRGSQAPAASLARHWQVAGERARAAEYLLGAARAAADQLAFERANALYRTAAELLADMPGNAARNLHLCHAWLGLAQGLRLVDRTDEALAVLERAEEVAKAHEWLEELADIHYLRGNLLFPRSDLDGCLDQHALARTYARRATSPRREASALGGLGDAYYMRGQILTAHDHFDRCIQLCRRHDFVDIEAANLSMRGLMRFYRNDFEGALRDGTKASALAARIGHTRAELIALSVCLGRVWSELGWVDAARRGFERALVLARSMGTRRLEAMAHVVLARILAMASHRDEAGALIAEGLRLAGDQHRTYVGPMAHCTLALVTSDAAVRARAMAEVEKAMQGGTLSAVVLFFHRDAMEIALATGDLDQVEKHARALEAYNRAEPLPWTQFFVERARALSTYQQGMRSPEIVESIRQLFRQANRVGFHVAAEALGQALAACG